MVAGPDHSASPSPDTSPADPRHPGVGPAAPALMLVSTALAMLLVHGWFRALAGVAALLGAGALVRAWRRSRT